MQRPSWALSQFDALNLMHEGSTAVVWEAKCRLSGARVALKLYDHASLCTMGRAQLAREVRLHSAAYRHPHVIRLLAVFTEVEVVADEGACSSSATDDLSATNSLYSGRLPTQQGGRSSTKGGRPASTSARPATGNSKADSACSGLGHERRLVAIVQEMAAGGNLLQAMFGAGGKLSESESAARVMRPLLSALQHLHAQGVVHRDIKPENVVFDSGGGLKLIDFGVAVDLTRERANTRAGTAPYMAPEVLLCPLKTDPGEGKQDGTGPAHSTAVDVWAVGCLLYEMLTGQVAFPHAGKGPPATGAPVDALYMPSRMSAAARDFITRCLAAQPTERPSVTELMRHPFLGIGTRAYNARTQADGDMDRVDGNASLRRSNSVHDHSVPLDSAQPGGPAPPPAGGVPAVASPRGPPPMSPLGPAGMRDPKSARHAKQVMAQLMAEAKAGTAKAKPRSQPAHLLNSPDRPASTGV